MTRLVTTRTKFQARAMSPDFGLVFGLEVFLLHRRPKPNSCQKLVDGVCECNSVYWTGTSAIRQHVQQVVCGTPNPTWPSRP